MKDYMIKSCAVNEKILEDLEETVQLIDVVSRSNELSKVLDTKDIVNVLKNYSKSLMMLDNYDTKSLDRPKGNICEDKVTYKNVIDLIKTLKFNQDSSLFGVERIPNGLESIINDLYATFDGEDIYLSIEEKCANLLYFVVKNHVFVDGNKRIAATLFIYFLQFYNILYVDNHLVIDNNTLAALTLLVAISNPIEKGVMIDLIMNFLN